MFKDQPEAVVNAIREILKKSSETAQQEQQVAAEKLDKKYESMKPVQEIAHVLKATDKADKANQEVKKQKGLVGNQHKLDKNKNGKLDSHDFKLLRKEEAETEIRDEKTKAVLKRAKDVHGKDVEIMGKVADMMRKEKEKKLAKEEVEQVSEEHGKKRIAGTVLRKVLAKKAMKEEIEQVEEGRGRPRKNPNDPKWQKKSGDGEEHEGLGPDSGKEADQHIHVRLAAAADQDKGADHKFDNGKTRNIPQHVAKTVYNGLNRMKPDVRAKMHDHIQKSHENLMQVHSMLAGKK